jgi:protein SCO1
MKTIKYSISVTLVVTLLWPVILMTGNAQSHQETGPSTPGITEKTGQYLPAGLGFYDEEGKHVKLASLINKPTILTLVYYSCTDICPQMLGGLANTLGSIELEPGRNYRLITISFDEEDNQASAQRSKANYIKAVGRPFPSGEWNFLTGGRSDIAKITDAVGFSFRRETITGAVGFGTRKESPGFVHPSVLIFLSPEGKITRYLYVDQSHYGTLAPIAFSGVEITTSLIDASQGRVWTGARNPLRLCFPRLSETEARFYTLTASVGTVTLICIIALFLYLRKAGRKRLPEKMK